MKRKNIFSAIFLLFLIFVVFSCSSNINIVSRLPKTESIRYNTNFKPELPYKKIVKSIAETYNYNSTSDHRFYSFSYYLNKINSEIFKYASNRFNLNNSEKETILKSLYKQKNEIAKYFFNELKILLSQKEYLPTGDKLFKYKTYTAVRAFGRILSSKLCTLLSVTIQFAPINPALKNAPTFLYKPCEIILAEALNPILDELKNYALLEDHLYAEFKIKEHVRELIIELATVQDKYKIEYNINPTRQFLFFKSEAKLNMKVNSTVKAGFDIKKYFELNIDENTRCINIYLPKAKILSIEIYPKIVNMENGWLVEIDKDKLNDVNKILRDRVKQNALDSGILRRAEQHAFLIIYNMLAPLIENPLFNYKINIHFGNRKYLEKNIYYNAYDH